MFKKKYGPNFKIRKTSFMDHRANIYVLLTIHFIGCIHMGLLLIYVTEGEDSLMKRLSVKCGKG